MVPLSFEDAFKHVDYLGELLEILSWEDKSRRLSKIEVWAAQDLPTIVVDFVDYDTFIARYRAVGHYSLFDYLKDYLQRREFDRYLVAKMCESINKVKKWAPLLARYDQIDRVALARIYLGKKDVDMFDYTWVTERFLEAKNYDEDMFAQYMFYSLTNMLKAYRPVYGKEGSLIIFSRRIVELGDIVTYSIWVSIHDKPQFREILRAFC